MVFGLIYHSFQSISIQGVNHPVYNQNYRLPLMRSLSTYAIVSRNHICLSKSIHRRDSSGEAGKFLGGHITDKLKWSMHTDSVVKKAQQYLFNLRRLKKIWLVTENPLTFTGAQSRASCRAVSPPGTATALPTTAGLSRG